MGIDICLFIVYVCQNIFTIISLEYNTRISNGKKVVLNNGDRIVGSFKNTLYCFNELFKFEVISRSDTKLRNRLSNANNL